jgi:Cd2+/Zn2+-exporting ATPase
MEKNKMMNVAEHHTLPNRESVFVVDGMCCSEEERTIRKAFEKYTWIHRCTFLLAVQQLGIEHSGNDREIIGILKSAGFPARPVGSTQTENSSWWQLHRHSILTGTAGVFTLSGIIMSYSGMEESSLLPLFLIAILAGGWRIALKGWKSALLLSFDMNFLMTIAILGAMGIGKWTEAAMVVFLFSLAQLLETFSMRRSRKAIQSLLHLSPPAAVVLRDGNERKIPVGEIRIGESIIIRPGERIPLDGGVLSGSSSVDQSPITGESVPVEKGPGNPVFAGTINQNGVMQVRVTTLSQDTTLARIIHMVEKAQEQRAPSQRFVDRFSRIYTPAVLLLAVATVSIPTLIFSEPFSLWFYKALVLLVISCPCALVISTPVSIVSALTRAARDGILIKGGAYLEEFGRVKAIAFDKTGTLTMGVFRVTDIVRLNNRSEKDILSIAGALESKSEHPLARAIVRCAGDRNISFNADKVKDFRAVPGRGVSAVIGQTTLYLGNHAFAEENGFCSEKLEKVITRLETDGKSIVILGNSNEALGVIAIADAPRTSARETMIELRQQGIDHLAIVTGDNIRTATDIGKALGIEEVHAELLPQEKVDVVTSLMNRYGNVAMVGDGINDAPALASSSVGVAMGVIGTDTAIETADVTLMADDVSKLAVLRRLSCRTIRIIKQNITLSILIKGIFLALAFSGTATLWMAIAADEGASLVVIANGLRLLRPSKSG